MTLGSIYYLVPLYLWLSVWFSDIRFDLSLGSFISFVEDMVQ